jgi:CRISPR-associated exonuclease Cas4
MNYEENDLLPLSALQHLLFCERQCALIHVEQVWIENILTAKGRHEHEKADSGLEEGRGELRIVRCLPLRSMRLGLIGKSDVVELHRALSGEPGATIPGQRGMWHPTPVEYKHGRSKSNNCDRVQLCAQALCLEEMLGVQIPQAALFYQATRRREIVELDENLRFVTESAVDRLHHLIEAGQTPPAINDDRCRSCSLKEYCMPKRTDGRVSVRSYLERMSEVGN